MATSVETFMGTTDSRDAHQTSTVDRVLQPIARAVGRAPPENAETTKPPEGPITSGLENYGNTCYANSVLQSLYYCRPFRKEIVDAAVGKSFDELPTVYDAISKLFVHINKAQKSCKVGPKTFVNTLRKSNALFNSPEQHDAQEFLIYLLNEISDVIEKRSKENSIAPEIAKDTFVKRTFEGKLSNEIQCLTCESITTKEEAFLDLSLDLEQNTSLTGCLQNFSKTELLRKRDKFFCSKCNGLQEATKRLLIKELPEILIIQLKRFKYVESLGRYVKLSHRIAYPTTLRVESDAYPALGDRLYRLYAVVVHLGSGPNSGHYVSLARCGASATSWKIFDDETVRPFTERSLAQTFGSISDDPSSVAATQTSYLLFYETVRLEELTQELLEESFHLVPTTEAEKERDGGEARPIRFASVESLPTAVREQHTKPSHAESLASAPSQPSQPSGPNPEAFGIPPGGLQGGSFGGL